MQIDKKLNLLPLSKTNPDMLLSLFSDKNAIPMWIADMDFQIAPSIQDALVKRITNSGFAYEYKPDSFFASQKKWYQDRYQIELKKEEVLYSPSITTSISILLENHSHNNEGVIIQPPVFMEFKDVIRHAGRQLIKNPLKLADQHYKIDFEDLKEKAKLPSNKILIICNPHNPVGRVWTKDELSMVINICNENEVLIISDEIHKDIILFNNKFTSLLEFRDIYDQFVVLTSEAKSFNLCGISDSMAIVPNEGIRKKLSTALKKYNLGRTNALTRVALEAAYNDGHEWLLNLIKTIEQNVVTIETELLETKIGLIRPEGSYQVWLDFRRIFDDSKEMFNQMTKNSGIAMNAGHWFGREGALFMRMNIATSNEKVKKSIQKIKDAISKIQ